MPLERLQGDKDFRIKVILAVFVHQHFCSPQDPPDAFTLTPKVMAAFQSKISIFACVTEIAANMGFAVTVAVSLQNNEPGDKIGLR